MKKSFNWLNIGKSVIEFLERELLIHNIVCYGHNKCTFHGKKMSIDLCIRKLENSAKGNKKVLIKLWNKLADELDNKETGSSCPTASLLFVPAIKSLYNLSKNFEELSKNGVTDALKKAVNSDTLEYSGKIMSRVVEYRLAIEWTHHLVRKDLYSRALVKKFEDLLNNKVVTARGTAGPWSRVDIPMLERVFEWDDISEEVAGRERDKRRQRRYRLGLEQYGEGDTSPNEGFYWREIRNEPYSFDSAEDSTYPHRNLLWV